MCDNICRNDEMNIPRLIEKAMFNDGFRLLLTFTLSQWFSIEKRNRKNYNKLIINSVADCKTLENSLVLEKICLRYVILE